MYRASAVVVAAALVSVGLSAQAPPAKKPAASKAPTPKSGRQQLTVKQIEQLVSIKTPDAVVSQEIAVRGVAETVTRQMVAGFRQKGAGPETVAALTKLIARATLALHTTAGAEVLIDGLPAGIAREDGQLTLVDLDPGPHSVEIRKSNFHAHSSAIQLPPNQTTSLDAALEWAVGFLTVMTSPADAQIRLPGGTTAIGSVSRMAVATGQATIVASAPLRETVSEAVTIEPGKEATTSLSLPLDPVAVNAAASQIHASFQSGSHQLVLQQSVQYLQAGLRDKDVLTEVAISNFELERFGEFRHFSQEALAAGGTLRFRLQHHHAGWNSGLHAATLSITAKMLGFQPHGKCNFPPFEVPLSQVRPDNHSLGVLNLRLPNPSNPKKESTMNLIEEHGSASKIATIYGLLRTLTH